MKNNIIFASIIGLILTFLLFLPSFTKNLYPFPGDFQRAWFEPWKSDSIIENTLTIIHKPIADDVFRQLYPFKTLAMSLVKKGEVPLWNPYGGAGMPLLATMHVGILNPFNIVFLILTDANAWRLLVMLQPLFIGFLMYLYCRKINLSKISSLFGTITLTLSGFVVIRSIYTDYDYALIGLLILLNAIEWYKQDKKGLFFIPLGVFLTITATQAQIFSYVLIFTTIYAIFRLRRNVLFVFLYMLIGIGLSAIQLVPTLELYQQAGLSTQSSQFIIQRFLLPASHFISIVIPNYFGNQATYNYWGSADYIETVCSVSLIPVLFALYIIRVKFRNPFVLFYSIIATITILVTLDWFFTRFLFSLPIPILSTGIPSRILFLNSFSIAILSAMGFDYVLKNEKKIKNFLIKIIPFLVILFTILGYTLYTYKTKISCNNPVIFNCREIAMRNSLFELTFLLICFFAIFLYLKVKNKTAKYILQGLIIISIVITGLYNSNKYLPFTTKENIMPKNDIFTYLQNNNGINRYFGIGNASIKTDFSTYYKVFDPNYYDPLYIKRYGELVEYANNQSLQTSRSDVEINNSNLNNNQKQLLYLLGTKSLIYKSNELPKEKDENMIEVFSNQHFTILQNKIALPRAYFIHHLEIKKEKTEILKTLFSSDFDTSTSAVVEDEIKISDQPTSGNVTIESYNPNKIIIQTKSDHEEFLILTDNYFPGWKAFVDNTEVKMYRTNYTFRGIIVSKGGHAIKFLYEPASFKIGMYISGVSLAVYVLFLLWPKIRGQKNYR